MAAITREVKQGHRRFAVASLGRHFCSVFPACSRPNQAGYPSEVSESMMGASESPPSMSLKRKRVRMTALSSGNIGIQPGTWRWAALGFVSLALVAGAATVVAPHLSGLGRDCPSRRNRCRGVPSPLCRLAARRARGRAEARRIAEAAASANVAWAITSPEGAVLECNDVYRPNVPVPRMENRRRLRNSLYWARLQRPCSIVLRAVRWPVRRGRNRSSSRLASRSLLPYARSREDRRRGGSPRACARERRVGG